MTFLRFNECVNSKTNLNFNLQWFLFMHREILEWAPSCSTCLYNAFSINIQCLVFFHLEVTTYGMNKQLVWYFTIRRFCLFSSKKLFHQKTLCSRIRIPTISFQLSCLFKNVSEIFILHKHLQIFLFTQEHAIISLVSLLILIVLLYHRVG